MCATQVHTNAKYERGEKGQDGQTNYRSPEKSGNGLFILACSENEKVCARAALNSAPDYHLQAGAPAPASDAFVLSNNCNNYNQNAYRNIAPFIIIIRNLFVTYRQKRFSAFDSVIVRNFIYIISGISISSLFCIFVVTIIVTHKFEKANFERRSMWTHVGR